MRISIIVAIAENNAIGLNNELIWHLPNDMKFFKETTLNHHVITGRKNYMSIPEKFRPLANRTNIILTRDVKFNEANCIIKHTLEEAIEYARRNSETEVFIIGGGQIYQEALSKNIVDRLYITYVHDQFEADTFFPIINLEHWNELKKEIHTTDEKHKHNYTFAIYDKLN